MKTWNGFAMLCALLLLAGDAIIGASTYEVVFHFALLIVNLVLYVTEER